MGWETNLDPKKLPKIKDPGFASPVMSMDDFVRFCARLRMAASKDSLHRSNDLEENFPVNAPFKIES